MSYPYLSIVIPAYNEEENFHRGVLTDVLTYLKKQTYSWELLLIDDGSTDSTKMLLSKFAVKNKGVVYYRIKHGGKQAAVSAGVKEANGKYVLFTDFDQSTPISETSKVVQEFKLGADVVIADRKRQKSGDRLISILRSRIFNLLTQIIVLPGINDTQCGFKAFDTNLAKQLFSKLRVTNSKHIGAFMGAFDVELLFLARKAGKKIVSIPVKWKLYGSNRLKWDEPFKMLWEIIKIRLYSLLGKY